MAYPASRKLLGNAVEQIARLMLFIKQGSQAMRATATGTTSAAAILTYLQELNTLRGQIAALAATPGIVEYARTEYNDPGLDVIAEYTATLAQIDDTRAWIVTNFPKDAQGNLLDEKFDANGQRVPNTFSAAQLATFRTQLDALIATID